MEIIEGSREWYIRSGYHDWTQSMTYDDVIRSLPKHKKRLYEVFDCLNMEHLLRDKRLLETAFNNGKTVFWTLERYGQICDIVSMFDFDPNVVKWVKRINKKWKIDIFESDVVEIKRPVKYYDIIFCIDVIEHLVKDTYHKMIKEISKLLKDDGKILVFIGKGKSSGHIHVISNTQAIKDFNIIGGFNEFAMLKNDFFLVSKRK